MALCAESAKRSYLCLKFYASNILLENVAVGKKNLQGLITLGNEKSGPSVCMALVKIEEALPY